MALVAVIPSFGQTMAAPDIILDGEYTYTVKDVPTTYKGLKIVPHLDADHVIRTIDIMVNGIKTQSFDLSGMAEVTRDDVHFLDANFDGKVDIMVGPGNDREFSLLFLWSPAKKSFVQATDNLVPVFNGTLTFDVRHKDVLCYNAYGVGLMAITRYTWDGSDMIGQEKLVQALYVRNYADIICNRYTVLDCKSGQLLASAKTPADLPERWRAYAYVPDAEEEAMIARDDAAYRMEQGMYEDNDETWVIKNFIDDMFGSIEALSPDFKALVDYDNSLVTKYHEIFCIDYDMWTQAQDFGPDDYHQVAAITDMTANSAVALMKMHVFDRDYTQQLKLVKVGGQWLVDDIVHDGFSEKNALRKCLDEFKKQLVKARQVVVVDGESVRLRTSPVINNTNILKDAKGNPVYPKRGEKLDYAGDSGDFFCVKYKGKKVYISKKFSYLLIEY